MDDEAKLFFEQLNKIEEDDGVTLSVSSSDEETGYYDDEDDEDSLVPTGDREGRVAIDVYQDEDNIIIEAPLAGVEPDNLDVNIASEAVVIKGTRERKIEVEDDSYYTQECYWGRFSRSVILPQEINPEKADAKLKNGILKIVLPKVDRKKSKKIRVKFD